MLKLILNTIATTIADIIQWYRFSKYISYKHWLGTDEILEILNMDS